MWRWRWSRKGGNVYGGERWDVIGDLDGVRSVDSVDGNGVEALRMGRGSGEAILATIWREGQRLSLTR